MPIISTTNYKSIIKELIEDALCLEEELKRRELIAWVKKQYLKKLEEEVSDLAVQKKLSNVVNSGHMQDLIKEYFEKKEKKEKEKEKGKKRDCECCNLL